jgi:hypothetical protein
MPDTSKALGAILLHDYDGSVAARLQFRHGG